MFTKFKTIKSGKKDYFCYNCNSYIPIGTQHSYGVTTDTDVTRYKNEIVTGRFCSDCRPLNCNADQHK